MSIWAKWLAKVISEKHNRFLEHAGVLQGFSENLKKESTINKIYTSLIQNLTST